MPKTNVLAKIKKIDIQNKILGEDWKQHITLTLGEIELTDVNLCALRNFRPHEEVMVNLSTLQLTVGDLAESQKLALLAKDIDATPAPLPTGMTENGLGGSGGRQVKPDHLSHKKSAIDYSLDASPAGSLDRDVTAFENDIETKVFENGEDDVDPSKVLKTFEF